MTDRLIESSQEGNTEPRGELVAGQGGQLGDGRDAQSGKRVETGLLQPQGRDRQRPQGGDQRLARHENLDLGAVAWSGRVRMDGGGGCRGRKVGDGPGGAEGTGHRDADRQSLLCKLSGHPLCESGFPLKERSQSGDFQ